MTYEPIIVEPLPAEIVKPEHRKWGDAGFVLYLDGKYAEAQTCFMNAARLDPEEPNYAMNVGMCLQQRGLWGEALTCYHAALKINPDHAATLTNLGFLNQEMGFGDNARRLWERALEINPKDAMAVSNLAVMYLTEFDFERGWRLFNARFLTMPPTAMPRVYEGIPQWDGKPCRKLAVWGEQGIGDQIMFGTLLRELERIGQNFVLEVALRLVPIFQRAFPNYEVVSTEESLVSFGDCDAHVPMMTIAQYLRPTKQTFIERQPYILLLSDQERKEEYAARYRVEGKKNIAISWRSKAKNRPQMNAKKSGSLSMFAPLAMRDDVNLVSVQYGEIHEDATEARKAGMKLPQWVGGLDTFNDIDGVLAVIDACDMVVTTCNVTAHYGAALGKPTYVLYRGDPPIWYWAHEEGRMLWYPTVRVITGEDWPETIRKVSEQI